MPLLREALRVFGNLESPEHPAPWMYEAPEGRFIHLCWSPGTHGVTWDQLPDGGYRYCDRYLRRVVKGPPLTLSLLRLHRAQETKALVHIIAVTPLDPTQHRRGTTPGGFLPLIPAKGRVLSVGLDRGAGVIIDIKDI